MKTITKVMQIEEIKQGLKYGDMPFIAKSSGYSLIMVKFVLAGIRNNPDILKAAKLVADNNKSLAQQIAIMCGEEVEA
jgi:hypothetical protein